MQLNVHDLEDSEQTAFPVGSAACDPIVPPGDEWWQPLNADDADDWVEGR